MDHVDHILIVDDDREIRELVSSYLQKNGLRTSVPRTGARCAVFWTPMPSNLIVLDVMMPGRRRSGAVPRTARRAGTRQSRS